MVLQSCSRQPRRKPTLRTSGLARRKVSHRPLHPIHASGVTILSHPQPHIAYLTLSSSPDTNQETSAGRLGFIVWWFPMLSGSPKRHVPRRSGSLLGPDPPRPPQPRHRGEACPDLVVGWLPAAQPGPTRPLPRDLRTTELAGAPIPPAA
jgi:hypothetical protein